MIRNRIIRSFVAVWCVVCLSYVGVRTAVATFMDSSAVALEGVGEAPSATESAEQDELSVQDEPTDPTGQDEPTVQEELSVQDEPTERVKPMKRAEPREHTSPSSTAQSEPLAQPEPDDSSERSDSVVWEEPEETEPQDVDQEEQVADVPSLEEYLSGFTCGSCRRNCSLDNPRCHNGSRLAQAKAEEYYSIYG